MNCGYMFKNINHKEIKKSKLSTDNNNIEIHLLGTYIFNEINFI